MHKRKYLTFWGWVLLAAALCWSAGPAFAAKPAARNPSASQNANSNKNPAQLRREQALEELVAAVDARIQVDPQFRRYVDAVNQYNNAMVEFVKAKKAEKGGGK